MPIWMIFGACCASASGTAKKLKPTMSASPIYRMDTSVRDSWRESRPSWFRGAPRATIAAAPRCARHHCAPHSLIWRRRSRAPPLHATPGAVPIVHAWPNARVTPNARDDIFTLQYPRRFY